MQQSVQNSKRLDETRSQAAIDKMEHLMSACAEMMQEMKKMLENLAKYRRTDTDDKGKQ